jgi:hypothetical protein
MRKFLAYPLYMFVFCLFMLFLLLVEAGSAVVMVVGAAGRWCGDQSMDSIQGGICKFKKTCNLFLSRVKNMIFSRYELSFKQESLFHVGIKTNHDAVIKYSYMVGTVKRGTFDFMLEDIKWDKTICVERVEVSHMSLPAKTFYGPIHMMVGDTLKVSYGKEMSHSVI